MEDKIPTLEEKYLKDIIEEKFEIPIYQRPYINGEKNMWSNYWMIYMKIYI